ncbi:MAG: tetratricopeptide repeat protein [Promethearchaeota archaeon]
MVQIDESKNDKEFYELGTKYYKEGKYDLGIDAIEKSLERNDKNHDAWYLLGILILRNGTSINRINRCVECFTKAVELKLDFENAWTNLGVMYSLLDQDAQGILIFKNALSVLPRENTGKILVHLGNIYYRLKEFSLAVDSYNKSLAIDKKNFDAVIGLAKCYMFLEDISNAKERLQEAVNIDPHHEEARTLLRKLLAVENQFTNDKGMNEERNLVDAYFKKGDYSNGIIMLQKVIENEPNNPLFLTKLGYAYAMTGDNVQALKHLNASLLLDPNQSDAYLNLGLVNANMKNFDKAIENWHKAVEIEPDNLIAWRNLGHIYSDKGNLTEATKAYERVLQIDPKDVIAWRNLGSIYSNTNDDEASLNCLLKASEIDPNDANVWNGIGIGYYNKRDYKNAINAFLKSLELKDDNLSVLGTLVYAYTYSKDIPSAIRTVRRILRIDPDNEKFKKVLNNLLEKV